MATPPLVNADHEKARTTVEAIKRAEVPVHTAVWAHFPGAEEWRFVIVTPLVEREGPRTAYTHVQRALVGEPDALPLQRLVVVGLGDPLAKLVFDSLRSSGRPAEGPISVTSTVVSSASGTVDLLYPYGKK